MSSFINGYLRISFRAAAPILAFPGLGPSLAVNNVIRVREMSLLLSGDNLASMQAVCPLATKKVL